jgi:hypothetical protein
MTIPYLFQFLTLTVRQLKLTLRWHFVILLTEYHRLSGYPIFL